MVDLLKNSIKRWWILLVIGILAIAVGILAFINPLNTFTFLTTVLHIFLIVSGILKIVEVVINRHDIPAWGWNLAAAIIMLVLAVLLVTLPYGPELLLAFLAGFTVIFEGINLIFSSFALRDNGVGGWGWTLALGIITIVLGVWLLSYPIVSMTFVVFLFGFSFLFMGIDLIVSAIALSKLKAAAEKAKKD